VRLMPPAYVRPYVRRQKNDAADAGAICEAVNETSKRLDEIPGVGPALATALVASVADPRAFLLSVPAVVRRHAAAGAGGNSAAKNKQRNCHSQLQLAVHANLHSSP